MTTQPPLFESAGFQRLTRVDDFRGTPAYVLDVPETIPQLGYGSHQFFRYYGKFPSVVGREIVDRFAKPQTAVLDCYSGSGTTLVEAQIAGHASYGLDINPLAVLASNVKTAYHDTSEIAQVGRAVIEKARRLRPGHDLVETKPEKLAKWFAPDTADDLGRLRRALLEVDSGPAREFLTLCFLAIVRRVSRAYDGEVRPHVNKEKRKRPPIAAFERKLNEMLERVPEIDRLRPSGIDSRTVIADNRVPSSYAFADQSVGLIVAHPPYLNSFNYLSVYSLEFMWAEGFEEVWQGWSKSQVTKLEHKAWPALKSQLVEQYYADLFASLESASSVLAAEGTIAVVIGDATIRGVLEPVHAKLWDGLVRRGFEPQEVWFRTTSYGIGKYAYAHRADYHGAAEKRDAVMMFGRA